MAQKVLILSWSGSFLADSVPSEFVIIRLLRLAPLRHWKKYLLQFYLSFMVPLGMGIFRMVLLTLVEAGNKTGKYVTILEFLLHSKES